MLSLQVENIYCVQKTEQTCLDLARVLRRPDIVALLVEKGAISKHECDKMFWLAAQEGCMDKCDVYLNLGCDINYLMDEVGMFSKVSPLSPTFSLYLSLCVCVCVCVVGVSLVVCNMFIQS